MREGLLIGSGCYESEVFSAARSKGDQELTNIISFYDYVEVQPPEVYQHLVDTHDFDTKQEVVETLRRLSLLPSKAGKTDCRNRRRSSIESEDRIYRDYRQPKSTRWRTSSISKKRYQRNTKSIL